MKAKKIFLNFILIMTLICASVFFIKFDVNAESDYEYIPTSTGGDLTYRGTDIKVKVPKTYEQKATEFRGVWV